MRKILFVGDTNSIHIKKWVDYFIQRNYEVVIATFAIDNITKCKNIVFLSNKKINGVGGNYHYFLSVPTLARFIKKYKPDYINAHYSYSMGLISLIALKMSGINANFSVVCHGSDILDMPHPTLYKVANKYALKRANKIFSVSGQITDNICKLGIDAEKIWTGQYGVSENTTEYVYVNRDIDIISNRNYVPNSRIDELLDKLNHHFFFNKKIVFVLPHVTKEKITFFRKKYPFITFSESVSHDKLLELVKRSKIYISATKSDGSSLSLLEALICGCYPIISNIPSNREWVVDKLNGRFFYSLDDLSNILNDALSEKSDFFESVAQLNKRIILDRATYEKQMSKIEKFLIK